MNAISGLIISFVVLALCYTYWRMFSGALKGARVDYWPLALLAVAVFTGLVGGLLYLIITIVMAGSINGGSLLGMVFGITLILLGVRTITR